MSMSYLIGGYWLLGSKGQNQLIAIVSGICFSTSLITLIFTTRAINKTVNDYLPLLNIGLFLYLGIYTFRKKSNSYIGAIFRSIIISVFVGFFAYAPISFKFYRNTIIAINDGNDNLISNMKMFDFREKFSDSIDIGDCDEAIQNAERSNTEGKNWLNIYSDLEKDFSISIDSSQVDSTNLKDLWKISGTYTALYEAYFCKGDLLYDKKQYEQAITYFLKADQALNICDQDLDYWIKEQSNLYNTLGLCYREIKAYDFADSLFLKAIESLNSTTISDSTNIAIFYSNLAESLTKQAYYNHSNLIYEKSSSILKNRNQNKENKSRQVDNSIGKIINYIYADSMKSAKLVIDNTLKIIDKESIQYCKINLYLGSYYYKLSKYSNANEIITNCLECFRKQLNLNHQNIAEAQFMLAKIKIELAEFSEAVELLNTGKAITEINYGKASVRYSNYLRESANINQIIGEYEQSERQYNQAKTICNNELGDNSLKLMTILSGLSLVEVDLAKLTQAKENSSRSIEIAKTNDILNHPNGMSISNNAAYINYSIGNYTVAEKYYENVISLCNLKDLDSTATMATALNGMGLVMSATKKYSLADSLFKESIKLHKNIFTDDHLYTAIVKLNYANLFLKKRNLQESTILLNEVKQVVSNYFDASHDIFGDINISFGDLEMIRMEKTLAREYYKKALGIYRNKFGTENMKTKHAKSKLRGSS